ncbi:MAG TPA: rhomboid family intramembrane serine protease [Candidatus Polarisedimenticolaceae bacterium]|nr:rhomboid family intramembrane serine protease [Candidatus Polarisedimenticolaceae bacterium]
MAGTLTRITTVLVALLVGFAFVPDPTRLEYQASRLAAEPWRLVTSQLVHWSTPMLVADALLVGIAGAVVERRSRALAGLAVGLAVAACAAAIVVSPGLLRYRGSSGIGTALLVAGGLDLAVSGVEWRVRLAGAAALAIGAIKIVLEGACASPLLPDGVVTATAAHVGGAAAGAAAWMARDQGEHPPMPGVRGAPFDDVP